jgi:ribonuclease HII
MELSNNLMENPTKYLTAGVDEVGRGALAGPVVAAAVILPHDYDVNGLTDSKTISPIKRQQLYSLIIANALAFAVGVISPSIIDDINILQATKKAMVEALAALAVTPDHVLVDGNIKLTIGYPHDCVIGGDAIYPQISAASIVAKVYRDNLMIVLDEEYPGYGLSNNKGYGTKGHRQAIGDYGVSAIHRKTFAPCRGVKAWA